MNKDVIISCDFSSKKEFDNFIEKFKDEKPFLKIGYQLFYATGKEFVKNLIDKGYRVFLDLKLHDIPNTVKQGIKSLVDLGVDFITIHVSGGKKMMLAAVEATKGTKTKILAVTQLTSIDQTMIETELLIDRKIEDVVNVYANNALSCGVHGIVCSALECKRIKQNSAYSFVAVTPGIRIDSSKNDQSRVCAPREARANSADYIVVGRPITQAEDPLSTYKLFKKEFLGE